MEKILFTDTTQTISELYYPFPASHTLPEWYKDMSSYLSKEKVPDGNGGGTGTLKRCMPVFDALTMGYILVSPADVYVSQKPSTLNPNNLVPYYEWPSRDLIAFHPQEQAPTYPKKNTHETYPKWVNPWSIKTPKGYSTLFTQPFHRESVFTILEGVVDTDTYTSPVNFPFVLNDTSFEGLIPAGTPIAQVIPFKRVDWEMTLGKDVEEHTNITRKLKTKIFDSYKDQFRQKKEYK